MIWLSPGVVPQPTPAVPLGCINALGRGLVRVNGRIFLGICHAYVYGGTQVPSSRRSPSGRGVEVEVAQVGALGGKTATRSLLRKAKQVFILLHIICLPCICVVTN